MAPLTPEQDVQRQDKLRINAAKILSDRRALEQDQQVFATQQNVANKRELDVYHLRDTLTDRETICSQKEHDLSGQSDELDGRRSVLDARTAQLDELNKQLTERSSELDARMAQLDELQAQLTQRESAVHERELALVNAPEVALDPSKVELASLVPPATNAASAPVPVAETPVSSDTNAPSTVVAMPAAASAPPTTS